MTVDSPPSAAPPPPVRSSRRRRSRRPQPAHDAVFLDASGRRWRRLRRRFLLLALPALLLAASTFALASTSPASIASAPLDLTLADTGRSLPVIGEGPLVRVLELRPGSTGSTQAFDPASGELVRVLSDENREQAGTAAFVLERYGYAPGPRTSPSLVLTFDGGPHPQHTAKLLDILRRHEVPASFFVTAQAAVREPDLVRRAAAEGHTVGSRTLTYANLDAAPELRARQELVVADRTLRALTGQSGSVVRLPYADDADDRVSRSVGGVLAAQRQGYPVLAYDVDIEDLLDPGTADATALPLPQLDGRDLTLRLHDGGGKGRQRTLDYVERLIPYAQARGYSFEALSAAHPQLSAATGPVRVTLADRAALGWTTALLGWPHAAVTGLFWFAVLAVVAVGGVTVTLALRRARRRRLVLARYAEQCAQGRGGPTLSVTVLIAAYNEEKVIARTLASLAASEYPVTELLVVDDGSTDGTARQVRGYAARDPRVRCLSQVNTGKSGALNHGLRVATGEIVVTVDADTLVSPDTVGNLVRHFAMDSTGRLAGVAGVVRVGNRDLNLLTRWQSLEYLTQISVERAAQDALGAITIVPGACAAWRRSAICSVGGYSEDTLAEDCDLSLSLHRAGWSVTQDDEALAFTEAPATVDDLLKQRVRWTFGTLQAITKHRSLLLKPRYGWLGMLVLPWYVASLVVPLLTIPFIAVMGFVAVRTQGWGVVGLYFAAFSAAHLVVAATGVKLAGESRRHLLVVPIYRVVYEPLRAYLLYVSALSALRGVKVGWNKLARAGSAQAPPVPTQPVPAPAPVPVPAPAPVPVPATPRAVPRIQPAVIDLREPARTVA